jgi:hypothetical protein
MMRGRRVRLLVASGVGGHGMEERLSASQVREVICARVDEQLIRTEEKEDVEDDDELDEDEDFDEDDDDFDDEDEEEDDDDDE